MKKKGGGGWGLAGVPYPLSPIPLRFSLRSQQAMTRIILAQRSSHIAITAKLAFLSIRNVQVHNYYTSPWLNFEVLGLDEDFKLNIWSTFLFYERNFPFGCVIYFPFRFFIQLSSQTVHMSCDFPLLSPKLHQYSIIF